MPLVQLPLWQVSPRVQASPSSQTVLSDFAGLEQAPVEVLQVPAVWHWSEAEQVTMVPEQVPLWQVSFVVQALPSLQDVPFAAVGFEQAPAEQVPATWHWSEAVQVTVVPEQAPFWHESFVVQALPSLQDAPFVAVGFEQAPVVVLHVPAVWHWSEAVQLTGLLPVQVPLWQVSVWVQALPSLQVVPFAAVGLEQAPVEVLHVPAVWHWSEAVQLTGLLPVQVPLWQVSVCVQALLSLQDVPSDFTVGVGHPVEGAQVPAVWHWSAVQVTGLLPVQVPFWQVSVCVQALPSLQDVPLATFVCVTTPAALHASAVHGLPSSMVAVTEPLQAPLVQVPAVVPMPFVQDAVPQAIVLLVWVTCPVELLQVSVVHVLLSSIVAAAPTWQLPAVLQKLAAIPCVELHEAAVLQAVLQQTPFPAEVSAQKPDEQSVPTPHAWPAASLSPHLFVSVLQVTLLQSDEPVQVVLQVAVVVLQP